MQNQMKSSWDIPIRNTVRKKYIPLIPNVSTLLNGF